MATTIFTPSMLKGAGTRGIPEMPVGSSYENTYSMAFDGIDERMTVSSFTTSGNDLTISLWIKLPNLGSGADYMLSGNSSNVIYYNSNEVIYAKINGFFSRIVANSGGVPQIFGTGNWHHLAITKSGSTLTWWIDGVSYADLGSVTTGGFTLSTIGAYTHGGAGVNGNLDEIAVWESDQTSNMATIYGSGVPSSLASLSPLGWWRMGEKANFGTNWTLTDQGSGGNDATSVNMEEVDRVTDVPS